MKEINLKINGMVCEGCENRVKNVLQNINGVEESEANHKTGEVKVILNDEITEETIEQIISDLGYEIVKEQ